MEYILLTIYLLVLIQTIGHVLLHTSSTPKTLAYLLLILVIPVGGMAFYYSFGVSFRTSATKNRMMRAQEDLDRDLFGQNQDNTAEQTSSWPPIAEHFKPLVAFLNASDHEQLKPGHAHLLINGESKFPEVLNALAQAQHFIHMEYYAWENDHRGNQIKEVLLKKAAEGLKVRVLYDDYASRKIKRNIVQELRLGGVEIHPKVKVKLKQLANRLNHRDHRKIIVVDGTTGYLGGINLSDRYDNSIDTGLWWRDTHVRITGEAVWSLQRHFLVSWNSSQPQTVPYARKLFPIQEQGMASGQPAHIQVVAGGPTYPRPTIIRTYLKLFHSAKKTLSITNPYFIPNDSILNALIEASLSGVEVKIILPKKSDSLWVGLAAESFFEPLLEAGVRIFLYEKGFVHAKTAVADGSTSIVGSANMDLRSFDLNFEVMAVLYSDSFGQAMEHMFLEDLKECQEINVDTWKNRGMAKRLEEFC